MKQIIPFKKELPFKTKVSEITSISLERDLEVKEDSISGVFHITGDYKMNEGSINREKFSFDLPFDITLDPRYDINTVITDIEDFYYDVLEESILKVNIDLFVTADYLPEEPISEIVTIEELPPEEREDQKELSVEENQEERKTSNEKSQEQASEESQLPEETREAKEIIQEVHTSYTPPILDIEAKEENTNATKEIEKETMSETPEESKNIMPKDKEIIKEAKETKTKETIENTMTIEKTKKEEKTETRDDTLDIGTDLFSNLDSTETYTTYYVYIVKEEDTVEKIITKFEIAKEDFEDYNDLNSIKPGDKVIIPKKSE